MSIFKNQPYYHETVRKVIIAVGQLFSDITLITKNDLNEKEQMVRVPIAYGPKNKWLERLREQANPAEGGVGVTLPRIAFEITDYRYDATRKIGTQGNSVTGTLGTRGVKVFNPVPYDVTIQLYSLTKDNDDALKILEQILPYFSPHIDINVDILPQLGIRKTIPLVLDSVAIEDTYDGSVETFRTVIQTFTFTAKIELFGPIKTGDVIKKVNTNITVSENVPLETLNFIVDPTSANKTDPHNIIESITLS